MLAWSWMELWLVPIGLLAGGFGGMLGIGGSILMIPAMMIVLGADLHVYQGAAMIVNFFVVVPATFQHVRRGAVMPEIVRTTIPTAAIAVLFGVALSESGWFRGPNEIWLSRLFGVFLWYEAGYNLWRAAAGRGPVATATGVPPARVPWWKAAVLVGIPTGLIGGLLGVGGGILAVPTQQIFLRIPLRQAIANSSATIVCLSAIGATFKNIKLVSQGMTIDRTLGLAAVLIPTAVIGGYWGARLTHKMPVRVLRLVLVVIMAYAGWRLIAR